MRRIIATLLAVCLVAASAGLLAACALDKESPSASKPEVLLSGAHRFFWSDASQSTVVWMDDRNGVTGDPLSNPDVYGFDLATHREFPICTLKGKQVYPRVSGDTVVWSDFRNMSGSKARTRAADPDIYGYDLATRHDFPICRDGGSQSQPAISGRLVVWTDGRTGRRSGEDIHGYDLRTRRTFTVCAAPGDQQRPAISGTKVVWADYPPGSLEADVEPGVIYVRDLASRHATRISPRGKGGTIPTIDGQIVIWQDQSEGAESGFYVHDLSTGDTRFVPTGPVMSRYALSAGVVIWVQEEQGPLGQLRFALRGMRLASGERFLVDTSSNAGFPSLWEGRAVWDGYALDAGPNDHQLLSATLRLTAE